LVRLIVVQVPDPLHASPTTVAPLHDAAPHAVPALAVSLHEPEPLHVPSGPQGNKELVGQESSCGLVYWVAGLHVPSPPPPGCCNAAAHAAHNWPVAALHALLQQ
jgi:hypothetical protein